VPRICSKALKGSIACCGATSARSSCRNDEAFVVDLSVEVTLVIEADGVEARERDEERGFMPGRGGSGPGPEAVGRLGKGEFVPEREAGDGGLGLLSCHIVSRQMHSFMVLLIQATKEALPSMQF
jgi:hypothetical protein